MKNLEALIAKTMENPGVIKPEKFKSMLETKRDIQREDSLAFISANKLQLGKVERWLQILAKECPKIELKALGGPICDGIIYPRCPLIFGENIKEHDAKLAIFLKSHYIPVRSVGNAATNDRKVAFVYLLDSDNQFTRQLIENLDNSLVDISA